MVCSCAHGRGCAAGLTIGSPASIGRPAGLPTWLSRRRKTSKPSVELYFVGQERSDAPTAERLRIRQGVNVLVRRRRYLSDDQPTEFAVSYTPWELTKGTPMVEENPGPW